MRTPDLARFKPEYIGENPPFFGPDFKDHLDAALRSNDGPGGMWAIYPRGVDIGATYGSGGLGPCSGYLIVCPRTGKTGIGHFLPQGEDVQLPEFLNNAKIEMPDVRNWKVYVAGVSPDVHDYTRARERIREMLEESGVGKTQIFPRWARADLNQELIVSTYDQKVCIYEKQD